MLQRVLTLDLETETSITENKSQKSTFSSSQASPRKTPSTSGKQSKSVPKQHSQKSNRCSEKNLIGLIPRRYRDIDGISSNTTPKTNLSLTSSNTHRRQRNKLLTQKPMSYVEAFLFGKFRAAIQKDLSIAGKQNATVDEIYAATVSIPTVHRNKTATALQGNLLKYKQTSE